MHRKHGDLSSDLSHVKLDIVAGISKVIPAHLPWM